MNSKYQRKYDSQSLRLQNWDYAWNAAYFSLVPTQCSAKKGYSSLTGQESEF